MTYHWCSHERVFDTRIEEERRATISAVHEQHLLGVNSLEVKRPSTVSPHGANPPNVFTS